MDLVLVGVVPIVAMAFIYSATTLQASAYTIASVASKDLVAGESEPKRWNRLFWALALGGMAVALMYLGGLEPLDVALRCELDRTAVERVAVQDLGPHRRTGERRRGRHFSFDRRRQYLSDDTGVSNAQRRQPPGQPAGGVVVDGESLYDEVAALVEWPVPVVGKFDEQYLELPPEVVTSTLTGHQRYFPVADKNGKLLPLFITMANIESIHHSNVFGCETSLAVMLLSYASAVPSASLACTILRRQPISGTSPMRIGTSQVKMRWTNAPAVTALAKSLFWAFPTMTPT